MSSHLLWPEKVTPGSLSLSYLHSWPRVVNDAATQWRAGLLFPCVRTMTTLLDAGLGSASKCQKQMANEEVYFKTYRLTPYD